MVDESDREIARRALDFQARAKDYPLVQLPGYMAWSERKLAEGVSPAFIEHLDAAGMTLLPEDLAKATEADFEELLADLRSKIGD